MLKYLIQQRKLKKEYENRIRQVMDKQKYQIRRIDVFAELPDLLFPFKDCSVLLNVPVMPVSFAECENNNKLLGVNALAANKKAYEDAKYEWVMKHCTDNCLSPDENFHMLQTIQEATLPFGVFTAAFRCHRLHDDTVKSKYSKKEIPYAPLLFDHEDIYAGVSDYFCCILAGDTGSGTPGADGYHQMNVYMDNVLTVSDIDEVYLLIKEIMELYNSYVTALYYSYHKCDAYRHRDDFRN